MVAQLFAFALLWQDAEQSLAGRWTNPSGDVIVLVTRCAQQAWCGTVEWASDKAIADAARAGTERLIGIEIMHDFVPKEANRWRGKLFVPDINKRSKAEVHLLDAGRLSIRGCSLGGLICKSQVWTRTEPP